MMVLISHDMVLCCFYGDLWWFLVMYDDAKNHTSPKITIFMVSDVCFNVEKLGFHQNPDLTEFVFHGPFVGIPWWMLVRCITSKNSIWLWYLNMVAP